MLKEGRQAWDAQFIPVPSSTGTAAECPIYKYIILCIYIYINIYIYQYQYIYISIYIYIYININIYQYISIYINIYIYYGNPPESTGISLVISESGIPNFLSKIKEADADRVRPHQKDWEWQS